MNEKTVKIKELFDNLYLHDRQLTAAEKDFVSGCRKYFQKNKQLSDRQIRVLKDILKFLPTDATIRYTNNK